MSAEYQIVNTPLPRASDFNWLKNEALGFIQKYGGQEWTNYNPADPGITILDQLCYALTELSYCSNFPIEDILSTENEGIDYSNQFYTSDQILTSAPVTINDFKRSLIDAISGIEKVIIKSIPQKFSPVFGIYEVWLALPMATADQVTALRKAAFLHLNQIRNVGTFFLLPRVLKTKRYLIHADLSIQKLSDLHQLVQGVSKSIEEVIFPAVKPKGYKQLVNEGYPINEIFNGPKLKNGWIPNDAILPKNDEITSASIDDLFLQESLVSSISGLSLEEEVEKHPDSKIQYTSLATCEATELITFDLSDDLLNSRIQLTVNGKLMSSDDDLASIRAELEKTASYQSKSSVIKSELQSVPEKIEGAYRDIESYYSIQNTFPEVYAIGRYAVTEAGGKQEQALSKQLGGYLSLFDQLLANQFSQLSNIDKLLSFKNATTSNPADAKRFSQSKGISTKSKTEYPAPFLKFASTAYYQSLYDVPNIRPLLKGTEAFESSAVPVNNKTLKNKAWKAYQQNPYNAYIHGLMDCVESNTEGFARRNKILDHLLARHGQSPALIDQIITGAHLTGDALKDSILLKSLYIQNFAALNYHEQSAYSFISADKKEYNPKVPTQAELIDLLEEVEKDFIVRSENLDQINQITTADFTNYSGLQLTANLLLAFRYIYRQFILDQTNLDNADLSATSDNPLELQQAYWLMNQKGGIFLETNLLSALANYEVIVKASTDSLNGIWRIAQYVSYEELLAFEEALDENDHIETAIQANSIQIGTNTYEFQSLDESDVSTVDFQDLHESGFQIGFIANWGTNTATKGHSVLQNKLILILPDFIEEFSKPAFINRLDLLMRDKLPLYVNYEIQLLTSDQIKAFIPTYVEWHNSLIHQDDLSADERLKLNATTQSLSDELITQLTDLSKVEKSENGSK